MADKPAEFDPTFDPTKGKLEETEFPPDAVPDPPQEPVDKGADA